jgi:hypothetical protein
LQSLDEVMYLPGRCQRRFIKNVEPFFACIRLHATRQMLLERGSFHASLGKFLSSAQGWSKAFNAVSFRLGGFADYGECRCLARSGDTIQPDDFFARNHDLVHSLAL